MPKRTRAQQIRQIAKSQAALSRSKGPGALGLTNKNKIQLAHASIKNTMKANRVAKKAKAKKRKK